MANASMKSAVNDMRAASKNHAKYEILKYMMDNIELDEVRDIMCKDEHSTKRFEDALNDVKALFERQTTGFIRTRLPKGHPDREEKD